MKLRIVELWTLLAILLHTVRGNDYEYYDYGSELSSSSVQVVLKKHEKPKKVIDHRRNGGTGKARVCPPRFPPTSTMCVYDDDPDVVEYGFSRADIRYILNFHNYARMAVKAEDMVKMYWDQRLAEVAQKKAQSCTRGHDTNANRKVPGYEMAIGQNACAGMSLFNCLHMWFREKRVFTFGNSVANLDKKVGHYTQMVNHRAISVGCGFADCWGKMGPMIFCNYAYGQTPSEVHKPYTRSRRRQLLCPKKFYRKDIMLCDFGLKYCFNYGTLDIMTGLCECVEPYKGPHCNRVSCNREEQKECGTGKFIKENCKKFINLGAMCPRMCGLCK